MAESNTLTQTTVLNVETVKAVKSVQDLKDNITNLKKVINEAGIGTREYKEAQQELAAQQNALREIQKGSAASIEEVTRAAAGLGTSYASLVNQMAKLRAEYRTTEDDTRRSDLAAQIKEINDQLKDMDASRGVFSRNVGDYANQMSEALKGIGPLLDDVGDGFSSLGIAIGGLPGPLGAVDTAMKTLSKNPWLALLGILLGALANVVRWLKSNEEAMNRVKVAMAPLNSLSAGFAKVMEGLGDALASTVEWLGKMASKLGLVSEEGKMHQHVMQEEIAIQKEQRELSVQNSESEMKISELRAKAADKDKYTAKERLEFLKQAGDEEESIAQRNLDLAKRELEMLKEKSKLSANSKEDNDALARAQVKVNEATTAYNNKLRELNGQIATATKEMNAQAKAAQEAADKIRALAELSDDIDLSGLDELEKINDKIVIPEDKWAERARLMQEQIDRETERQIKKNILLIEDEQKRADEEVRIRRDAEERKLDALREAESKTTDPMAKIELQRQIADMELDIEVAKQEQITEEAKKAAAKREEILKASFQGLVEIAAGTADLLDSIADSMEVTNAKEFKRQQNLQVASATINMLTGAVGAFMQAMATYPPPVGQIVGAAMSALALTTGAVQISKIKQQKYTGDSSAPSVSASPVAVSPPNIQTQLPTVATLTGAKEEERLNRMASPVRAYIVDSELQAKEVQRKTIENETTF